MRHGVRLLSVEYRTDGSHMAIIRLRYAVYD